MSQIITTNEPASEEVSSNESGSAITAVMTPTKSSKNKSSVVDDFGITSKNQIEATPQKRKIESPFIEKQKRTKTKIAKSPTQVKNHEDIGCTFETALSLTSLMDNTFIGKEVASFLTVHELLNSLALTCKVVQKVVLDKSVISTRERLKEVWWGGVTPTWYPSARFAPESEGIDDGPRWVLHYYDDESIPPFSKEEWSACRVNGIIEFKQIMGRPIFCHLSDTSDNRGSPRRLHQVVAFLERHFDPEMIRFQKIMFYTLHTLLIHVTWDNGQSAHLIGERSAANISYRKGLFAKNGMGRYLFGDDTDDERVAEEEKLEEQREQMRIAAAAREMEEEYTDWGIEEGMEYNARNEEGYAVWHNGPFGDSSDDESQDK